MTVTTSGSTLNRCARLMGVAHGGQIVCSTVTAELVRDRGDLRDLGEHRLRDLSRAERVFQVGGAEFAALRSLDVASTNLPLQLSSFVGREAELAEIAAAVRDARLVTLTGAPKLRILATSREGFGIPGERVRPLRSLSVAGDDPASSDAVVLFVERAEAVAPGFALNAQSTPAVVELCRRLDGIPLAIELAAARVATMSPADIVAHLDERFRLLTGGRRGRVERHQTLRAAIE